MASFGEGFASSFTATYSAISAHQDRVEKNRLAEDKLKADLAIATKKENALLRKNMSSLTTESKKNYDEMLKASSEYEYNEMVKSNNNWNTQQQGIYKGTKLEGATSKLVPAEKNVTMSIDDGNGGMVDRSLPESLLEFQARLVDSEDGQVRFKAMDGDKVGTDIDKSFQPIKPALYKNDSKTVGYTKMVHKTTGLPINVPANDVEQRGKEGYELISTSGRNGENLTNEDKFVASYLKSHPDADRVEASTAYANRNTPSVVKTENHADKLMSGIATDLGVDVFEYNINNVDKSTRNRVKATGMRVLRERQGKNAPEIIADAKRVSSNIDRLSNAQGNIEKAIADGKDVNFIEKLYRDWFGKYTDVKMTDEDYKEIANNKQVSEVFNNIRHSLYGSVLTTGENKNFFDQAASLFESNPALVVGIGATIDSQLEELKALESQMGGDVFRTQFGNRIEALEDRRKDITTIESSSNKSKSSTNNTFSVDKEAIRARMIANRNKG